jgi:hypothetical protein
MIARGLAVCRLFFISASIATLSGENDDAIRVEVERPRLVVDTTTQSPYLTGSRLSFDARFTNSGDAPVEIPDRAATGRVAGIGQHGVESKQSDGSWKLVEDGGNLMWRGDTIFPTCKSLNPKETIEVKGVSGPFVVFKSNLKGLAGATATLRLDLVLPCKQRDGKLTLNSVKSDPFVLSVPPLLEPAQRDQ